MSFHPLSENVEKSPLDKDLATLSNYQDVRTLHLALAWTIDWEKQIFGGSATLQMEATKDGLKEVVLDSSYLDISSVKLNGQKAEYKVGERVGMMGEGLHVTLPAAAKSGEKIEITVLYSTTPRCTAIGWLTPAQTKSKKYPYLYSQSQAIHGRAMFPCQDTPAVKATYSARVKSVLPVLMSGLRVSPPSEAEWKEGEVVEYVYDQPVAIPTYLVAIASGELVYRAFKPLEGKSWRCGVWAEPGMIEECFWEFSEDTAKFVAIAESHTSDYKFGVYDVLVLPESFPYGGMENACLTFATPTVVCGDRSGVDVVAHEISHSWFGNGIGCASWCHFWLNEGWTTYCERLCVRQRSGEAARQLSFIIGRNELKESLALYKDTPRFQRLIAEYKQHEDPDEGYNQVSYEKGSNFLLHLERTVGGLEHFEPYMKDYVKTFDGTSITTGQWRAHLFDFFGKQANGKEYLKKLGQVDWDGWLHGDGGDLCVDVQYDDSLAKPCYELAKRWGEAKDDEVKLSEFSEGDVKNFITQQKQVFLSALEKYAPFPPAAVQALDKTYGIHKTENVEIRLRFYRIALRSGSEYAEDAAAWVINKGRMKFCRSIFRLLNEQKPELAKKTFEAHKDFYHPIARKMIAKDLGVTL